MIPKSQRFGDNVCMPVVGKYEGKDFWHNTIQNQKESLVDKYLNEFNANNPKNARDLNRSDDQISRAESPPNAQRATRNKRLKKTLEVCKPT